jgi:Protein of unknown function (DUF1569)
VQRPSELGRMCRIRQLSTVNLNRRYVIITTAAVLAAPSVVAQSPQPAVKNLSDALKWLDVMLASPKARTTSGWSLPQVLEHLAQSIEFSLHGFPQAKSALFQSTVGAAAFAVFKWRGKMSHGLAEPIPGAAKLLATDLAVAAARLRASIAAFEAHKTALKPHFAYGDLSKADYALAHSFHIANHQELIDFGKAA